MSDAITEGDLSEFGSYLDQEFGGNDESEAGEESPEAGAVDDAGEAKPPCTLR